MKNDYSELISFLEKGIKRIEKDIYTNNIFPISKTQKKILSDLQRLLLYYYEKYYISTIEKINSNNNK